MYISKSLSDGLKIIGLDKETTLKVSKEKNLEEIFLNTLFLNYLIVLVVYFFSLLSGGVYIESKQLNSSVFFGILMVYPFFFNLIIYLVYSFYGLMAELLDKKNHIKPLVSVGFHTAIVYTLLIYLIGLFSTISLIFGLFLFVFFITYFLLLMFRVISVVYEFSTGQSLIIVFLPVILIGFILMFVGIFFPEIFSNLIYLLFN